MLSTLCRRPSPPGPPNRWPQSLSSHLGEDNLKEFINFCLKYLLPDRLLHCEKPRCRNAMHIDCAGLKVPCCALCECSW